MTPSSILALKPISHLESSWACSHFFLSWFLCFFLLLWKLSWSHFQFIAPKYFGDDTHGTSARARAPSGKRNKEGGCAMCPGTFLWYWRSQRPSVSREHVMLKMNVMENKAESKQGHWAWVYEGEQCGLIYIAVSAFLSPQWSLLNLFCFSIHHFLSVFSSSPSSTSFIFFKSCRSRMTGWITATRNSWGKIETIENREWRKECRSRWS